MIDEKIKRDIIIDHYQYPRNKKSVVDAYYHVKHNASDSCIDDFKVFIKFEGDKILDVYYDGIGCAISTSSTSIFSQMLKNKSISFALNLIKNYEQMLDGKEYDEDILEELVVFENLYKQANRIKCGLIGINTMKEIIEEYGKQK